MNGPAERIAGNLARLRTRIAEASVRSGRSPEDVALVAVSKTFGPEYVLAGYDLGLRHFGENRMEEAEKKLASVQEGLHGRETPTWHMVGHLQTNKAKIATELFDVIHSVDSLRAAEAISQYCNGDKEVLIQVNVAGESSKHGFALQDTIAALEHIARLPHLRIKGLMTIAPYTDDAEEIRPVFRRLRLMRDSLGLEHLSMGMSLDFEVAIEEGATLVRIGQAIFGGREE